MVLCFGLFRSTEKSEKNLVHAIERGIVYRFAVARALDAKGAIQCATDDVLEHSTKMKLLSKFVRFYFH